MAKRKQPEANADKLHPASVEEQEDSQTEEPHISPPLQ